MAPNQTADDLENRIFELETKLESRQQESQDLANIASVITSILDIESVLAAAMEIAIRQVSGEVGAIVLVGDEGPKVRTAWGVDSDVIKSIRRDTDEFLLDSVLDLRESIIENSCRYSGAAAVTIRNAVASPIISKGEAIGAIVVLNRERNQEFGIEDVFRLEMIARFTSIAIDNATLFRESLAKQQMEQELDLARQVQETLLPEMVEMPGVRIHAKYIPARQVGGDYYDLIPISDTKLLFVIGDVASKGAPAALVMTAAYSIVRSQVPYGGPVDVTRLMSHLNDALCRDIIKTHEMFITLFMGYLDLESGTLEFCNAGHPPPFYYRSATGETVRLKSGGPFAGQFQDISYSSSRIDIHSGDRIFCYTDGLIEAARRDGTLFGLARLEEYFKGHHELDTATFAEAVMKEIRDFSKDADADTFDDYTTILVDVLADSGTGDHFAFEYASRLDNLERMYADLDRIFRDHDVPGSHAHRLQIAASEAMTNAVIHAHDSDASKIIRMTVDIQDRRIEIRIADQGTGPAWDPATAFDPIRCPDDENGRGLGLIQQLADETYFDFRPGEGLTVRIVKKITQA